MSDDKIYIKVIIPLRVEWEPYYYIPDSILDSIGDGRESLLPGTKVSVMFANRKYLAVITESYVVPDSGISRILPVLSIETGLPRVSVEELELWRFISDYYMCTIGEVYKAAYLPLRIGREMNRLVADKRRLEKTERERQELLAGKERLQVAIRDKRSLLEGRLTDKKRLSSEEQLERLLSRYRRLEDKLNELGNRLSMTSRRFPSSKEQRRFNAGFTLSPAQKRAYDEIKDAFGLKKPVLLHGVTGSGKTEIYISLAIDVLNRGKNVLYLIPEIAVSRQLEERLLRIFGDILFTFHSKETLSKRQQIADELSAGQYVVIGTRSSVFLPHNNLGLVIVDEEHDTSYKQTEPQPRYNGRDTALVLSRIFGADIILGTATPSLESIYNCSVGRMVKVNMYDRYFGAADSDVIVIDTRAERRKNGMSGNFSYKLIDLINRTLERKEQVLLLRARRAYAPAVQCTACGMIPRCPHCNVPLSWHKEEGILLCHYCGWRMHYDGHCPSCGGTLESVGAGTQKIEEEAGTLFPRAKIARLDSDVAQSPQRETAIIKDFAHRDIDILIGTQIVTKGFDFDGLSLVAVIGADSLLGQQDFRADERAFQLLEQFRGRSGRRGEKGIFAIQTSQPDYPVYQTLTVEKDLNRYNSSESLLIDNMMYERRAFGYPPFYRIIDILLKDSNESRVAALSDALAREISSSFGLPVAGFVQESRGPVSLTGPFQPVVDRRSDNYLRHIRMYMKKDNMLSANKKRLMKIIRDFEAANSWTGHIALDVDPV